MFSPKNASQRRKYNCSPQTDANTFFSNGLSAWSRSPIPQIHIPTLSQNWKINSAPGLTFLIRTLRTRPGSPTHWEQEL